MPVRGTPILPELYCRRGPDTPKCCPRTPCFLAPAYHRTLGKCFPPKPLGFTSWEMNSLRGLWWLLLSQVLPG